MIFIDVYWIMMLFLSDSNAGRIPMVLPPRRIHWDSPDLQIEGSIVPACHLSFAAAAVKSQPFGSMDPWDSMGLREHKSVETWVFLPIFTIK